MSRLTKFTAALIIPLFLCATGCSWLKGKGTAVEQAAVSCAQQDLGQTVIAAGETLLMTVAVILANGGTNWSADLAALEAKYGADAVECAVHVAEALFMVAPAAGSDAGAGPATGDETIDFAAHDRAEQYLKSKGGPSFK